MTQIPHPPDMRALMKQAGLSPKKSWGQNFLRDQQVLGRIAEATGCGPDQPVVELGSGLGALTHHLLAAGGVVLAVERDRELVPVLRETMAWAGERLMVHEADAASVDYNALAAQLEVFTLTVCGNLPYQLSGRVLGGIANFPNIARAVFMVQREVAQRVEAQPGSKAYGLLSVLVRRGFDAERLFDVPPQAFLPAPKVTSSVIRLTKSDDGISLERKERAVVVARMAFAQRRKMLRRSLGSATSLSAEVMEQALLQADVAPTARAEELSLEQFCAVGDALRELGWSP